MRHIKYAFVTALTMFSWMNYAQAADGVIHFRGSIVNYPCRFDTEATQLQGECFIKGRPVKHTQSLTANYSRLPENLGSVKTQWLNAEKTVGLMTVSYN